MTGPSRSASRVVGDDAEQESPIAFPAPTLKASPSRPEQGDAPVSQSNIRNTRPGSNPNAIRMPISRVRARPRTTGRRSSDQRQEQRKHSEARPSSSRPLSRRRNRLRCRRPAARACRRRRPGTAGSRRRIAHARLAGRASRVPRSGPHMEDPGRRTGTDPATRSIGYGGTADLGTSIRASGTTPITSTREPGSAPARNRCPSVSAPGHRRAATFR